MPKITRNSLLSTPAYVSQREEWRKTVIPFKKLRTLHLGKNATLIFENELTIRYQLQEMIRVDRSMERDPLETEMEIYNGLIPNGNKLCATMMFEFVDSDVRGVKLRQLKGVENKVWIQVDQGPRIFSVSLNQHDDLNKEDAVSVYFLNFNFDPDSIRLFNEGHAVAVGIDHPAYPHEIDEIAPELQAVLMQDFQVGTTT